MPKIDSKLTQTAKLSRYFLFATALLLFAYVQHSLRQERPHPPTEQPPMQIAQKRTGVSKDCWVYREKEGSHYCITSPHTTFLAHLREGNWECVEKMDEMRCYVWELGESAEKTPPWQTHYFHAKEGIYNYTDRSLTAQSVHFAIYHPPFPQLSPRAKEIDLQGVARGFSLSLAQGPDMHASGMKIETLP